MMVPPLKGAECNPISSTIKKATCPFLQAIMSSRNSRLQKDCDSCLLGKRLTSRAEAKHLQEQLLCWQPRTLNVHCRSFWEGNALRFLRVPPLSSRNPQPTKALLIQEYHLSDPTNNCSFLRNNLLRVVTSSLKVGEHFKTFVLENISRQSNCKWSSVKEIQSIVYLNF
jgi:hypothetical protein